MQSLIWYSSYELLLPDIVRAENCSLFAADGQRYVDLESGVWSAPLGHAQPDILARMTQQAERLGHSGFCFSTAVVDQAAQAILQLLAFEQGGCTFLCSGSEAVEYCIRSVQSVAPRPLLLTMHDTYAGSYGSAWKKAADEWFCFDWSACGQCPDNQSCTAGCPQWQKIPFSQIGAFFFEPGSSSGFVRFPPEKLIRSLAAEVKGAGGYLMANEVTTGIGRTGSWFGYQHYSFSPDAVAIGKGIGNGYPVSVAALSPQLLTAMADKPLPYAQSHQNDPFGASIALEVLRLIWEQNLLERCRKISALLQNGFAEIKEQTGLIEEVRARGLMLAVEIKDDCHAARTQQLHRDLIAGGYILSQRPGRNVLRLDPALTVEEDDIGAFLATFARLLAAGC